MSRTAIYKSWSKMLHRATNERFKEQHPTYGDVSCCPEWLTFDGFMANPPRGEYAPGMVLARDGDSGDYTPTNARWATRSENCQEASTVYRDPEGVPYIDIARAHGVKESLFRSRIRRGWEVARAATEPPNTTTSARPSILIDGEPATSVASRHGVSATAMYARIARGWEPTRAATEQVAR